MGKNRQVGATFFCLAATMVAANGCGVRASRDQTLQYHHQVARETSDVANYPPAEADVRRLAMFSGSGQPMGWNQLLDAAKWADVIVLGEQHDDAIAHAVQLAVTEDVFSRWPGSAISLEMLERDEQPLVDDYLDGIIDSATLAKLTHSENWAGEGTWIKWYQPLIDVAKNAPKGRAVAANAPRRYVRLARMHGYERLKQLPRQRRSLFDFPRKEIDGGYRERFFDLMSDTKSHTGENTPEEISPEERARRQSASFQSQSLWDATMAASIVKAKRSGATKVVHCVGQFHSDFHGGMVQQIKRRLPRAKILVISMQRSDAAFREEDLHRADIIVYTGKPPEPENKDETETEETPDESPAPAREPEENTEANSPPAATL